MLPQIGLSYCNTKGFFLVSYVSSLGSPLSDEERLARQAVSAEPTTTRPATNVPAAFRLCVTATGIVGKGHKKSPETRKGSAFQGVNLMKKAKKRRCLKIQTTYAFKRALLASPRGFEPLSTA